MTGHRSAGRADAVALAAAALVGAASFLPAYLASARHAVPPPPPAAVTADGVGAGAALARARRAEALLLAAPAPPAFAERRLGPLPSKAAPPVRVARLDGSVSEGRLVARWSAAAGSRGTTVRVSGLGGPGTLELDVPAGTDVLRTPVSAVAGTLVVTATPLGVAAAEEERVSIPFRVPVEILRAESANMETRSALLILRRAYDGRAVEAPFHLSETQVVGGLSSVADQGTPVDFQTEYVLEAVRALRVTEPRIEPVPRFLPDGRVLRRADGTMETTERLLPGIPVEVPEVVLRGPAEERRILRAAGPGPLVPR